MSYTLALNANFGSVRANATGSTGVGYTLLTSTGVVLQPRTTTNVTQLASGSGIYGALVTIPDNISCHILWDTGSAFSSTYYASEEINHLSNNIAVDTTLSIVQSLTGSVDQIINLNQGMTGTLDFIRGMTAGRWKIINNQMLFYDEDNISLLAAYNLFDASGSASSENVLERIKV